MVSLRRNKKPETPAAPQRPLPEPRPMKITLTGAFKARKSSYDFSDEPISDEDLACILWAADGRNGSGKKDDHRTTPTTLNWQEIDIYVVKANGVWLWHPETGSLEFVPTGAGGLDRRKDLCMLQPLVKSAPVHLVYVYNSEKVTGPVTDTVLNLLKLVDNKEVSSMTNAALQRAPLLDAGAKSMSVYLACAALGINCLTRLTFVTERVTKAINLKPTQEPLCIQTIGYKPRGLLDLAI